MEYVYFIIIILLCIACLGFGMAIGHIIRYYDGLIDLCTSRLENEKKKTKLLEDMLTSSANKDYDRHDVTIVNKTVIWDEED